MEWKLAQKRARSWLTTWTTSADINMNGQKLEDVTSFKYLVATLCKDGTCPAEICMRIASAMARLKRIWWPNTISFTSKFRLCKSLVMSILSYGCETWILLADSQKGIQASETNCLRKLLISNLERKIGAEQDQLPYRPTGTSVPTAYSNCLEIETRIVWACHKPDSLSETICQGTLEGGRCRSWQRKCWIDNVKEWTSLPMPELLTVAFRKDWKRVFLLNC